MDIEPLPIQYDITKLHNHLDRFNTILAQSCISEHDKAELLGIHKAIKRMRYYYD